MGDRVVVRTLGPVGWDHVEVVEQLLHGRTQDWPGPLPQLVPASAAWYQLGRPHVLIARTLEVDGRVAIERTWFAAGTAPACDIAELPSGSGLGASGGEVDLPVLAQAVLPTALIDSLASSGLADDLVVIATEDLRGLPWPLLPVPHPARDGTSGEWLTAYAAVTLLPSLSWGVLLAQRAATPRPPADTRFMVYLEPKANLDTVRDYLDGQEAPVLLARSLPCLAAQLQVRTAAGALVAAHGILTSDGSVDLRDHTGAHITPETLRGWPLPPITILSGCHTGASNRTAPLHLAEAALMAGADHVIVATHSIDDEVLDVVLGTMLPRLPLALEGDAGTPVGSSASQALQSALQQLARAYRIPPADPMPWSIVHVGLPGSVVG